VADSGVTSAPLSYQNAPPFSVPMRFFLTAPLFALAAAALLLGAGEFPLSRWQPAAIAATHLVLLGFVAMIMVGALFQLIPVLCGGVIPRARLVAGLVHTGLTAGALLFPVGLVVHNPFLIYAGITALGVAFSVFLIAAFVALRTAPGRGPSAGHIRLALLSLLLAVCLGMHAAAVRAGAVWVHAPANLPGVHLAWGLIGWVGLLLIGVAYQVVPMFQITPSYPDWLQRYLGKLIFSVMLIWSAQLFTPLPDLILRLAEVLLAGALMVFAGLTLWLQFRRRRQVADVTLTFWRLGMGSLLLATLLWSGGDLVAPAAGRIPAMDVALGILVIVGCIQSVICGMLYKIVPFLAWLHLQSAGVKGAKMHDFLPRGRAELQLRLHGISLALLLAVPLWPQAAVPAGLIYAVNFAVLQSNLMQAAWRYLNRRQLATAGV
jgi:hypothetical protein